MASGTDERAGAMPREDRGSRTGGFGLIEGDETDEVAVLRAELCALRKRVASLEDDRTRYDDFLSSFATVCTGMADAADRSREAGQGYSERDTAA